MKKSILILCIFIQLQHFYSQNVIWQKDFSTNTQDFLVNITPTIDRQMVISGSVITNNAHTNSLSTSKASYDYQIIKLNQQGETIWTKQFGGTNHDYLAKVINTSEGGFLLSGTSTSNDNGTKKTKNLGGTDVWIIRLDENGEELWQKSLGTDGEDEATGVIQTTDGGFMIAGTTSKTNELFGGKDVFITRLDKDGNTLQTIYLGGKYSDEVIDFKSTKDGGFLLLMYSNSGIITNSPSNKSKENDFSRTNADNGRINYTTQYIGKKQKGYGYGDFWIVKIDNKGAEEWQKTYGGIYDDMPKKICVTNNGFVVIGESASPVSGNKTTALQGKTNVWVLSLDEKGNDFWQKNYPFGENDIVMSIDRIKKADNNNLDKDLGFLIGGYSTGEGKKSANDDKFWLLYIDTNGNEIWRKYIDGKEQKRNERLVDAKYMTDGSLVIAGTSTDEIGKEGWKIVKIGDKYLDDLVDKKNIKIYPNPVENYCYVELDFAIDRNNPAEINIYDMSGKQILNTNTTQQVTKISTEKLIQGVYIVAVKTSTQNANAKIIKK